MTSMPDGNTAALRRYEAEQDAGAAVMEQAEAKRDELVENFLQSGDTASVEELIGELLYRDPQVLTLLRRMLVATQKTRSLGNDANREAVLVPAVALCSLIRAEGDRVHGGELVDKEADAITEDVPCRCRGDCTC